VPRMIPELPALPAQLVDLVEEISAAWRVTSGAREWVSVIGDQRFGSLDGAPTIIADHFPRWRTSPPEKTRCVAVRGRPLLYARRDSRRVRRASGFARWWRSAIRDVLFGHADLLDDLLCRSW